MFLAFAGEGAERSRIHRGKLKSGLGKGSVSLGTVTVTVLLSKDFQFVSSAFGP